MLCCTVYPYSEILSHMSICRSCWSWSELIFPKCSTPQKEALFYLALARFGWVGGGWRGGTRFQSFHEFSRYTKFLNELRPYENFAFTNAKRSLSWQVSGSNICSRNTLWSSILWSFSLLLPLWWLSGSTPDFRGRGPGFESGMCTTMILMCCRIIVK